MAHTVEIRSINPGGRRRLFVDGNHVEVDPGETIKVTPEAAGTPPRWRHATEDEITTLTYVNPLAFHSRERAGHTEVLDLGAGLLAQDENWIPADVDPATHTPIDPLDPGHPVAADTETEHS